MATSAPRGYWQPASKAARHATDGPLVALVLCYLSYPTAADGDHAGAAKWTWRKRVGRRSSGVASDTVCPEDG